MRVWKPYTQQRIQINHVDFDSRPIGRAASAALLVAMEIVTELTDYVAQTK
jgi:hypothetical protein